MRRGEQAGPPSMELAGLLGRIKEPALRARLTNTLTKRGKNRLTALQVQADPYLLLDAGGWSLALVDRVAAACGVAMSLRARRVVLQAVHALVQDSGNSVLQSAELKAAILRLGRERHTGRPGIAVGGIDRHAAYLDLLEEGCELVLLGGGSVVWAKCLAQEQAIWSMASAGACLPDKGAAAAAALAEQYQGLPLSDEQRRAVVQAFGGHRISLVSGAPGCGKSACCDAIAQVAKALGMHCHFVAFTWLAAQRISQSCKGVKATSIHRYAFALRARQRLGTPPLVPPGEESLWFDRHEEQGGDETAHWPCLDLLVLDEASMASVPIMYMLLGVLPISCRLLLVGDADQLNPIGFGQPFADLVAASRQGSPFLAAPMTELTRVFRTDKLHIADFALACRQGKRPAWMLQGPVAFEDFVWHAEIEVEAVLRHVARLLQEPDDCQVLVAGKRGPVGTWALNALAVRLLRPDAAAEAFTADQTVLCVGDDGPVPMGTMGTVVKSCRGSLKVKWRSGAVTEAAHNECSFMAAGFAVGDKVIYTDNAHTEVSNGERGHVVEVARTRVLVAYGNGARLWHGLSEQAHLQLAYALTVHKFQGNEVSHAVVVVHPSHGALLHTRNLLYTAATRGKEKVTLLCEPAALDACLAHAQQRSTCLAALLAGDLRLAPGGKDGLSDPACP